MNDNPNLETREEAARRLQKEVEEDGPFACPRCGGTTFVAEYQDAVGQTKRNADGSFEPKYLGEMVGDSEAGPDESYRCEDCDWTITVGRAEFKAFKRPRLEKVEP